MAPEIDGEGADIGDAVRRRLVRAARAVLSSARSCDDRYGHGVRMHDLEPVSAEALRRVAGTFATGVTAITTLVNGEPRGCAANAVTSLSLEPPLMLVCLARSSNTHASLRDSRAFAINILDQSAESRALCRLFASRSTEKFTGVAFERGKIDVPILAVAMSWLECELVDSHDSGDHTIFIGRVLAAGDAERMPLLYFRGQFGSLLLDSARPERPPDGAAGLGGL